MKKLFIAIAAVLTLSAVAMSIEPSVVAALDPGNAVKQGVKGAGGGSGGDNELKGGLRDIINILLYVIGAIAVIMIVVGGIKYTISNGDSAQIKSAKDTILYAVVGLVVALLAYAIVNFVVDAFV